MIPSESWGVKKHQEPVTRKTIRCPSCGQELPSDARKCTKCNAVIDLPPLYQEDDQPEKIYPVDSLEYFKSALKGRYEVLEKIAETENAFILRATHVQLVREVALKVLSHDVSRDREYTEAFHRKARAIDRFSHNNIVRIYDEGVEGGVHYMAMEFLKGSDLERKISEHGTLSPDELANIMVQVISGLGNAHDNGIVHGNIKCSSVFLHRDGRIILFGFGADNPIKEGQPSYSRTPKSYEYLSPEEAAGKLADARSDIYSLGVAMYYSLTGRFPFTGGNRAGVINSIIKGEYIPLNRYRQLPQWIERVVDRCLRTDPSKRLQSCSELLWLLSTNVKSATPTEVTMEAEHPPKKGASHEPPQEKPVSKGFVGARVRISPPTKQPPSSIPIVETRQAEPQSVPPPSKPTSRQAEAPARPENLPEPIVEYGQTIPNPRAPGKRKSRGLIWILAIALVALLGSGVAIVLMNKGESAPQTEPTVNTSGTNNAMTTTGQTTPKAEAPAVSNNAAQTTTNGQTTNGPSTTTIETGEQATEPTSAQINTASNSNEVKSLDKSKEGSSKSAVKSRVVPVKRLTAPVEPTQPSNAEVSVPDLIGAQLNVAKSILSLSGLAAGTISSIPDPRNDGLVIRQIPKPGTQLKKGSTVNLITGSK